MLRGAEEERIEMMATDVLAPLCHEHAIVYTAAVSEVVSWYTRKVKAPSEDRDEQLSFLLGLSVEVSVCPPPLLYFPPPFSLCHEHAIVYTAAVRHDAHTCAYTYRLSKCSP
jgi:hypothetical protein